MTAFDRSQWALVLGGSSGMGLATALRLHAAGMSVCVAHRDRRGSMPRVDDGFAPMRVEPGRFVAVNVDALGAEGSAAILDALHEAMGATGRVRTMLHAIALGNLKPLVASSASGAGGAVLGIEDIAQTVYNMGTSLLTWVQALHSRRLFAADARVFGLTSEGNALAWPDYAAVSIAKCALEASARAIAVEFAPFGIRCNVLQPGVTDTAALRLIPSHAAIIETALARNPFGRLTRPEDVASMIALLSSDEAAWMTGSIVHVDGGEHISAGQRGH